MIVLGSENIAYEKRYEPRKRGILCLESLLANDILFMAIKRSRLVERLRFQLNKMSFFVVIYLCYLELTLLKDIYSVS